MVSITSIGPGMTAMLPPPLPINKRPTNLKRDSSYLDTDDESGLSIATKRFKFESDEKPVKLEDADESDQKKVTFDNRVDTKILDDALDEKPLDLIREEVKWAIHYHIHPIGDGNDDERYGELINLLKQEPGTTGAIGSKQLLKHLIAFESQVNNLGDCGKLVKVILDQDWLGRDDTFIATYVKFMVSLASAHSKYLYEITERLLQFFTNLPSWKGRIPGERVVSRTTLFQRVHLAIKTVLRRVPAANEVLVRVSKSEYPGESATSRKYAQYQRHLLRIGDYAPEVKSEIVAIMVQRVVALDVEVQLDLEELEDEAEERLLHRKAQSQQPADESDESDDDSSSDETLSEEDERMKEIRLKVAKIDCTMDVLFEHYDDLIRNGADNDADEAYKQLLSHFTTFIMPNRTRHAQFLLFHFAQTSERHMESFASHCMSQGFAPLISTQRLTAIAYLASFIARGAHIQKESVQLACLELCKHLDKSRKVYEAECRGPDRRKYPLYYAIAQALLYIFCFRWRDLVVESDVDEDNVDPEDTLAEQGELQWIPGIKAILDRNITSPLNPLKVCAPAVVSQFAGIARHTRFMEIISIIEKNKRLRFGSVYPQYGSFSLLDVGRRETAIDRKQGDSHHQMEPYFPFDPYHLPTSKRWVEGDYIGWQLPKGMRVEENDDDESDDGSEDDSGDEEFDGVIIDSNLDTASISS